MQRRRWVFAILVVVSILAFTRPAPAQVFIDGYGGLSLTQNDDLKTTNGVSITFKDVEFDSSYMLGARVGYWFRSLPFLGLAVDGAYFRPDIDSQSVNTSGGTQVRLGDSDVKVGSAGIIALVQIPIPIIKPYVFAGPAVFITELKDKAGSFGSAGSEDTDYPIGFKAGGGIRLMLLPFLGIFAEYQFSRFSPEYELRGGLTGTRKVETDLETHHLVSGVTLRF